MFTYEGFCSGDLGTKADNYPDLQVVQWLFLKVA